MDRHNLFMTFLYNVIKGVKLEKELETKRNHLNELDSLINNAIPGVQEDVLVNLYNEEYKNILDLEIEYHKQQIVVLELQKLLTND